MKQITEYIQKKHVTNTITINDCYDMLFDYLTNYFGYSKEKWNNHTSMDIGTFIKSLKLSEKIPLTTDTVDGKKMIDNFNTFIKDNNFDDLIELKIYKGCIDFIGKTLSAPKNILYRVSLSYLWLYQFEI